MQEYPVKRGYTKTLEITMVEQLRECFDQEPVQDGDHWRISFGALKQLDVCVGEKGKTVIVDTVSNIEAPDEAILETNRRFRKYLDQVTGYNTKERVKKAKKVD